MIVLLLPGLAFVRRSEWERGEPLELAGVAFASSAAYWAASFWLLERVPLSWRFFAVLSGAGAILVLAFPRRASISLLQSAWRGSHGRTLGQLGLLAGVLALRLAFAGTHVAYSGGDMTAHAALAEEIALKDGFPHSQEPLLPIPRFGESAPGLHALSALVSLLSGVALPRSARRNLSRMAGALSDARGARLVVPLGIAMAEVSDWTRASRQIRIAAACLFLIAFALEGKRLAASRFGTAFYGEAKSGRASAASVLANEAAGGAFWVTTFCQDDSAVTAEDISAFAWIRSSTPDVAVFANNPGDGGGLLPAAAHRKIVEPHYYWFFDRSYVEAWRATTRVDHVYVGAQPAAAWDRRWTAEQLDADPRVTLVHASGRAREYRIKEEFAASFR